LREQQQASAKAKEECRQREGRGRHDPPPLDELIGVLHAQHHEANRMRPSTGGRSLFHPCAAILR